MKILTIRLEGAMQAWGDSAYEVRGTHDIPTHSGVLGIIGSAMGFDREDPAFLTLTESLTTAFRIDAKGSKMRDYQTLIVSKPKAKVGKKIVEKFYLSDASFLVAIYDPSNESDALLDEIGESLKHPANTLFLGRKSCPPSRRLFDGVGDYDGVAQAFSQINGSKVPHKASEPITLLEAWIPGNSGKSVKLVDDIPLSFSTLHRQRTSRVISRIEVRVENPNYVEPEQTPDSLFDQIGE